MVNFVHKEISEDSFEQLQHPFNWISLPIQEVYEGGLRLEASVYGTHAEKVKLTILNNKYGYICLSKLLESCSYPGRFKRNYVPRNVGVPFYLPSQLNEIYPKANKFISVKKFKNLDDLIIKPETLLITRSGTIGNCTISNKTLTGGLFSDDIIRIKTKESYDLSYLYVYLKSDAGKSVLKANNYGAVIKHIEPEHLLRLPIPNAQLMLKKQIHSLITKSFDFRDKSNELLNKARYKLKIALSLPEFDEFSIKENNNIPYCFSVNVVDLAGRLEANYHHPIVRAIEQHIYKFANKVTTLADKNIVKNILLPSRFKRYYVEPNYGVPFIGGKEVLELDPRGEKYLSLKQHNNQITTQLTLNTNTILITCSGTIGKVTIIPKHWDGWTASQHLLRVIPVNHEWAGYLYAWLSSEWALPLIRRYTYGAVVFEIDQHQLSKVVVPLIEEQAMRDINEMVLFANDLRTQAFVAEQEALKIFNDQIL